MKNEKEISVFLVDDDEMFIGALQQFLSDNISAPLHIEIFPTGEACLKEIDKNPAIVVLDYHLDSSVPDAMNGISVLKKIKLLSPSTHVIMLSSQDSIEVAMDSIKHGAYDYVAKSESAFIRIKNIIRNIAKNITVTDYLDNKISLYKKINIAFVILIILLFLLSRIF